MEFIPFLQPQNLLIVRKLAVQSVLGLSGDSNGLTLINICPDLVNSILVLAISDPDFEIRLNALDCLLNISSEADGVEAIFQHHSHFPALLEKLTPLHPLSEKYGNLASNLTTFSPELRAKLTDSLDERGFLPKILDIIFVNNEQIIGTTKAISRLLCNLTSVEKCRRLLLAKDLKFLQRALPLLLRPPGSVPHLEAIVGTLRNCCFDNGSVGELIEADIARYLIHPLAGPGEYRENELPDELVAQYAIKKREPSPTLRIMLVEALLQLGATVEGREYLHKSSVYPVLRELHKWEEDRAALVAINNLVTLLIGEEPGKNLRDVDIPPELLDQFVRWDIEDLTIK